MNYKLSLAASKEAIYKAVGKVDIPVSYEMKYKLEPSNKLICMLSLNMSKLFSLEWGLIPHWSKTLNNRGNLCFANTSNVMSSTSTRIPYREKRGVALCDGVYFIKKDLESSSAYRLEKSDKSLMKIACLWDEWEYKNQYLSSAVLLYQDSQNSVFPNFPLILDQHLENLWMNDTDPYILNKKINYPIDKSDFNIFKVSNLIIDSDKNGPELAKPLVEEINLFNLVS